MKVFNLPDLGEGLPDAEIVKWHVQVGDSITAEQSIADMETAKSVVEVLSPFAGEIAKLHGEPGDVIETGSPLVSFTADNNQANDISVEPSTTVGDMPTTETITTESNITINGLDVSPVVAALARKLKIDLDTVKGTGPNNKITLSDIHRAKSSKAIPSSPSDTQLNSKKTAVDKPPVISDAPIALHGTRRSMFQNMSKANSNVMNTTVYDHADISAWNESTDITIRIIQAMIEGYRAQPALNAWLNSRKIERTIHSSINIGIAIDSEHGLYVPVIKQAELKTALELRSELNRLRQAVENKTITAEDLQYGTISLSNFGTIAGRYATPIVNPPQVAILGTGRIIDQLRPLGDSTQSFKQLPLSLSFDHRAVTGGEATRFLATVIKTLELGE